MNVVLPPQIEHKGVRAGNSPRHRQQHDRDVAFAVHFFPEIREWLPVASRLGLPLEVLVSAAARKPEGTDLGSELVCSGAVEEGSLYRALAEEAGLSFVPSIDPSRVVLDEPFLRQFLTRDVSHVPVKLRGRSGDEFPVVAPQGWSPQRLRRLVMRYSGLVPRLKVTSPAALRRALIERSEATAIGRAVTGLFDHRPEFSARLVLNAWQGAVCGAMLVAFPLAFAIEPGATFMAIHYASTALFLACVWLRFLVIPSTAPAEATCVIPLRSGRRPVYSVLVALHREAAVVPGLLGALDRIEWPRSRLQILLVCERDDPETIDAIRSQRLPAHVEIVEVPPTPLRTKPKALSYAMHMVRGDFVVPYDAEDEPHPLQLEEAWQRFRSAPSDVACLQAPLEITEGCGFIARMFAFEYRALFGGLLPWLARRRLLLPLGGTSSHFRRDALEEVGGWDPFNVTEDADLGVRLARFGYRTEVLTLSTREPAPTRLGEWLPQRTRWLKGWMQTWLVHMRRPMRLAAELGPRSFAVAQILFAGMVVSAIVHPLLVVTVFAICIHLAAGGVMASSHSTLLLVDAANIACGYSSFLLLGYQTLHRRERHGFWKVVLLTPAYWLLMSLAAWRAVLELRRNPHHWNKTPHPRHATARRASGEPASGTTSSAVRVRLQ